tara:strand:+ start:204 stop:383 length:180 start_codon:yes stop_codon:yes gene_type:complete
MKTIEELKNKLRLKTYNESQKLVYMWIKQGVISLAQFKVLSEFIMIEREIKLKSITKKF